MKKIVLLMFAMLIALSVKAQNKFGLMGGINASTSSADHVDWRIGGFVGGIYDIPLTESIYLQPRLVLSYQENERTPEFHSQWNASVPVLASYKMRLNNHTALRLNAGPYIQYAVFGREKPYKPFDSSLRWWHYDFGDKITYGGQVGLQVEHKKFFTTIDFKHSFRRNQLNINGFENTIQVGIGYIF